MLMPVQLNSTGVTERHCQLCFFFFHFTFSDLARKRAAPCCSTCTQPFAPQISVRTDLQVVRVNFKSSAP